MIVYEGRGDIFEAPERTRVCPINVVGAMGKGLALAFKRRYQGLNQAYLTELRQDRYATLNEHLDANRYFQMRWKAEAEAYYDVLLVPTKLHWRDKSDLAHVEENLKRVADNHEFLGVQDLAFPMMGCGEGGLDYTRDVKPLMHRYFGRTYPYAVSVYFGVDSNLPTSILLTNGTAKTITIPPAQF